MKKVMKGILVLALLMVGLVVISQGVAQAQGESPIQLSLFNPIQLVPEDESIKGLRLNVLYSSNADVSALDLGIVLNRTTGDFKGLQLGIVNWTEGESTGLQLGFVNYVAEKAVGLQYGTVNVAGSDFSGIQWGLVNWTEGSMRGLRYGAVNVSKGESVGLDIGLVNYNDGTFKGLQLGVVNYTKSLNGVQIGIFNYNGNKDPMEMMVLVNWSF